MSRKTTGKHRPKVHGEPTNVGDPNKRTGPKPSKKGK